MTSSLERTLVLMCAGCWFLGNAAACQAQQTEADAKLVETIRAAAEKGDPGEQYALGEIYFFSEGGVTQDYAKAVYWFRKAAEQGHGKAQSWLGVCYEHGDGVAKDIAEAVRWYRMAAAQGVADAQLSLGNCCYIGEGVAKDYAEALKWYRKAAAQGDPMSESTLGVCYHDGEGVAKDYKESVKWWRKAAGQGIALAQYYLGVCYYNGVGVAKDYSGSAEWYRNAAEQGFADAQCNLGRAYGQGQGVAQDYVQAYKWLNLSAAQGNEAAIKYRGFFEKSRMTREQIAEGQRLASEFKPRQAPGSGVGVARPENATLRTMVSGTGFFISEDGYLVTNEHVVKDARRARLVTQHGLIAASVVKVDAANDLAILKAEGNFPALPVASSRGVRLGATAATVGFPNIGLQGFAPKLAKGEIASLAGAQDDPRHFQISAPIQPGNSGGALVDERGNVIGVVVAKLSQQAALATSGQLVENVNYAVKSSFLLGLLESLPEVTARLKEPNSRERKFEEVVEEAQEAAALVLVY